MLGGKRSTIQGPLYYLVLLFYASACRSLMAARKVIPNYTSRQIGAVGIDTRVVGSRKALLLY